jgi:hypothetical protein
LTTINDDILEIMNQAYLKIVADDKLVEIKHKFRLKDKSNLGVIFFLFGGLFLIIAPFIKTSDTTTKIIGIVLGLLLAAFSILTIIRQVTDGLQIKDQIITFRLDNANEDNAKKLGDELTRIMNTKFRQ